MHAVRSVELIVQPLVAVSFKLLRFIGHVLPRVQDRRMVELGEGVDIELPVGFRTWALYL